MVLAEYIWQKRLRFAGARVVEVSIEPQESSQMAFCFVMTSQLPLYPGQIGLGADVLYANKRAECSSSRF